MTQEIPDAYQQIADRVFTGATVISAHRLTGGVSADVWRLALRDAKTASIVLRIHGSTHGGHDADLEYRLLRALHAANLPVPQPLLMDAGGEILPEPFIVMEFVTGNTLISAEIAPTRIDAMAALLARIHATHVVDLPDLPARLNPLPEVLDYLPPGDEWEHLRVFLTETSQATDTAYQDIPALLHGDFWPENLLWQAGEVAAILDWEDAALGDPLSDVAACGVELRYLFGPDGQRRFIDAYARHNPVDPNRLALWQIYVAAAAQHFMGEWRLDPAREAHMRREALASIAEAFEMLRTRPGQSGI